MSADSPEMASTATTAERVYFAIYERMAAKSDYLQPDNYNQMLPEAVIVAGVVSIITGILSGISEGFLGKVGEDIADQARKLLTKLKPKKDKPGQQKPDELVAIIAGAVPMLQVSVTNWDEISACIALELTRQGMRFPVSQELAREIAAGVKDALGAPR
jgi:hypothetical protein